MESPSARAPSLPLCLALLVYDCLRLLFLLAFLAAFLAAPGGPAGMFQGLPEVSFPYIAFIAPNALFPLMSLFLLIRFGESKAFIPLYISGKVISAAALAGWIVSTVLRLKGFPPFMRWSFFLCTADLASVAGAVLLGLDGIGGRAGSSAAESIADADGGSSAEGIPDAGSGAEAGGEL
jgi:hypothetical protein